MSGLTMLKCFPCVVALVVLTAVGCLSHDSAQKKQDGTKVSVCPQEMCVFLFDRLEEQSVRLHNIEAALLRTVSILASVMDQEYSTAVSALKSDPLINSLLIPDDFDPVESFVLHSKPTSDYEEAGTRKTSRKKRQTGGQSMTPKERLAEALGWAKKSRPIQGNSPVRNEPDSSNTVIEEGDVKQESQYSQSGISSRIGLNQVAQIVEERNVTSGNKTHKEEKIHFNNVTVFLHQQESQIEKEIPKNVTSILSSSTTQHVSNSVEGSVNHTTVQKYVKDAVGDLQSAWKCAIAQLNETNPLEPSGILFDPRATLNPNNTLTVQFELKNCQKYWTAVWIRVSVRSDFVDLRSSEKNETSYIAQIPKQCLKRNETAFWITLPSIAKAPCFFPLLDLLECKVYTVDVIPIYLALQGQASFLEITVPPQSEGNSTELASLEQVEFRNSTHMLGLRWSVKSGDCAKLMTSAYVQIYEDASDTVSRGFTVPAECLGDKNKNSFFSKFSSIGDSLCPSVSWNPLDICRKYKVEVEPEYSSLWKGKSSSLKIYTPGTDSTNCCFILTNSTGRFQSFNSDGHYYGCSWLISVERDSTIWLTFTQLDVREYYRLKVYDGPYSTSRLLLDYWGQQPPNPIRSQTNKLFVKLDPTTNSYYDGRNYGKTFTAHYISVCDKESKKQLGIDMESIQNMNLKNTTSYQ